MVIYDNEFETKKKFEPRIKLNHNIYIPKFLSLIKTSQPTDDSAQAENHARNRVQRKSVLWLARITS